MIIYALIIRSISSWVFALTISFIIGLYGDGAVVDVEDQKSIPTKQQQQPLS